MYAKSLQLCLTLCNPMNRSTPGLPVYHQLLEFTQTHAHRVSDAIAHGTTDWFQIGKGVRQGCILSPCLFNLYAEYIMRNAGLEETQGMIRKTGMIGKTLFHK